MSKSPKAKSSPSRKKKITAVRAKQPKVAASLSDNIPVWARDAVFAEAGIVAWSGPLASLQPAAVSPQKGSFLQTIMPDSNGSSEWLNYIHPLDKTRVSSAFVQVTRVPFSIDYRLVDVNGEPVWVRHSLLSLHKQGSLVIGNGFVRNIQVEKELELESLRISEREQNRIGQDLHDDLCQVLAGVSCLMRVEEGRLASKVPEEVPYITELNQQIVDAMHRTRALTHGLFPGKIQIADVRGALLELVSQVKARFQIEVKTDFVGRFPHHSSHQIIQVYRLAQEAISNAIKHGHATCIKIRLEARHANMYLSIIDNGSGLNQSEPAEKGVGHHIMQSRTRSLGGALEIRNGPDRGVIVSLTYPFQH